MYRVKTRGFNANLPVFLVVLFGAVLLITAKSKNAPITRDLRFMNRTQVVKYPAFQTFTVSSTEAQVEFTHSFFVGLSIPISYILQRFTTVALLTESTGSWLPNKEIIRNSGRSVTNFRRTYIHFPPSTNRQSLDANNRERYMTIPYRSCKAHPPPSLITWSKSTSLVHQTTAVSIAQTTIGLGLGRDSHV